MGFLDLFRSKAQIDQRALQARANVLAPDVGAVVVVDDSSVFNAYATATPDGTKLIVLHEGLIAQFRKDPEALDFVLAHELAHHRHAHLVVGHLTGLLGDAAFEAMRPKSIWESIGLTSYTEPPLWLTIGKAAYDIWAQSVMRQQELEADATAVAILRTARVDLRGATRALIIIQLVEGSSPALAQLQQKLFGDHPLTVDRQAAVKALIGR